MDKLLLAALEKMRTELKADLPTYIAREHWPYVIGTAQAIVDLDKMLVLARHVKQASVQAHAPQPTKKAPAKIQEKPATLVLAMAAVMGKKTMNAREVLEALIAKDWGPASNNPHNYISGELGKHPATFKRVGVGKYKCNA